MNTGSIPYLVTYTAFSILFCIVAIKYTSEMWLFTGTRDWKQQIYHHLFNPSLTDRHIDTPKILIL